LSTLASGVGDRLVRVLRGVAERADERGIGRAVLVGAGVGLVAVASVGVVAAYLLSGSRPGWWPEIDTRDPAFVESAERVHNGLASELHRSRAGASDGALWKSEPWRMAVRTGDANAWLAVEMRRWMEDRAAEKARLLGEVGDVVVSFSNGKILAGASVDTPEGQRYLWTTLTPEVDTWGSLWLRAETVHVGRLPMPAMWVLESAASELGDSDQDPSFIPASVADLPETRELIRTLLGERPMLELPVLRLIDGRRVRLLALEPRDGYVEFLCRTERTLARAD